MLKNVISNTSQGSIIVFHDSLKAEKKSEVCTAKSNTNFKNKGFTFDVIK